MKILVTGATGLIGAALIDEIESRGHTAISAVRDISRAKGMAVKYDASLPVDFGNIRADWVIHAACSAHPMAYSTDPAGVMRANITGTMNLLDWCCDKGANFLFLSSGEVYGTDGAPEGGYTEEMKGAFDTSAPRACYPVSKIAAENMCASWAKQYNVGTCVSRLCHVYGGKISPSNTRADAQFLRRAASGEDIIMKSSGEQIRSYMYVKDAARGLLTLIENGARGVYNVSTSETASVRDYAETLAKLAGVKVVFENPSDAERAGYSRVPRAVLNPSKIAALGFRCEYSLEQGLAETLNEYRQK